MQPGHRKTSAGLFLPTLSTLLSWPGGSWKSSGWQIRLRELAGGGRGVWLVGASLLAGGAMERGAGHRRPVLRACWPGMRMSGRDAPRGRWCSRGVWTGSIAAECVLAQQGGGACAARGASRMLQR